MKDIEPILDSSRIYRIKDTTNRKKLFEKLAELLTMTDEDGSEEGPSFQKVLDGLITRERLGCTCIGKGVGIPHCKLPIDKPKAAIIILDNAMKFNDDNDKYVDIIFGLLVPIDNCEQHLHILSSIAKLCLEESWLDGLRKNQTADEIYNYVIETKTNAELDNELNEGSDEMLDEEQDKEFTEELNS